MNKTELKQGTKGEKTMIKLNGREQNTEDFEIVE